MRDCAGYPASDVSRTYVCRIRHLPERPSPFVSVSPIDADDPADLNRPALRLLLAAVFLVVAIGGAVDVVLDRPERWLSLHVVAELTLMVISLSLGVFLWRGWRQASHSLARARRTLVERQAERDVWKQSAEQALAGLSVAVQRQLESWGLTPVEREVALLLLKGHGHKQIAALTGRSERTVRQHAVSIYEKSGLGGRAELAAFFLEGLMLSPAGSAERTSLT